MSVPKKVGNAAKLPNGVGNQAAEVAESAIVVGNAAKLPNKVGNAAKLPNGVGNQVAEVAESAIVVGSG